MPRTELPIEALSGWTFLNDVDFVDVKAEPVPGRGLGLVSEKLLTREEDTFDIPTLMKIPHDLVLSSEAVDEYAKVDRNFRQLLDIAGHQSTRGDILLFLITQLVHSSHSPGSLTSGVSTPWTEYVKFLPGQLPLPTMWTEQERRLLKGTSLESAIAAKILALTCEYDDLREKSSDLPFWNNLFWDTNQVSLADWFLVDAWYRSRCLELPRSGESMVPCLDMANHASNPTAYYEENGKYEVVLLLRPSCKVSPGEEITISYGDSKSGAEMLFSYGFIDPASAIDRVTLALSPFPDDPLSKAKRYVFKGAPTLELSRTNGNIEWQSPFAYLMCLNEEDGLAFRVLQETGGAQELSVFWQHEEVTKRAAEFESLIQNHPLSEVFKLRVVSVVQDRVATQLELVRSGMSLEDLETSLSRGGVIRGECVSAADLLREMETDLLEYAMQSLEEQKSQLLADENVVAYLGSMENAQNELVSDEASNDEDDFS